MSDTFSCYVIGEDSLLIKCGETLLDNGHDIFGIIASNPSIKKWANERNINVYELNSGLGKILNSNPYDYLFSITNLSVLPDEIINSPRKAAINFHDGPLPKFAGINATSWALMNQEKKYAITWHEITSEVDKGDILKQIEFDIDEGEIALSLNAKCFEAGASAFEELVDELAAGTVKRTKQDFSKRSYFGKYKRPDAAALIDWDNNAEKILAFVHALNFGRYRNPLGLPKIKIGEKFFIIPEIEITNDKSKETPGTITSINEKYIKVSTKTNDVKLSKLLSIDGLSNSIANLIEEFSLKIGTKLNQIDDQTIKNISEINSTIAKKEDHWVKELTNLELININYAKRNSGTEHNSKYEEVNLSITKKVFSGFKQENQLPILAASLFSVFIGRHGGKNNFTLGFSNTELIEYKNKLGNLFAEFVPFKVEFNPEESFSITTNKLIEKFDKTIKAKTFVRDIFPRYPELHHLINDGGELVYPVSIVIIDDQTEFKPQPNSVLTFVVPSDLKTIKFIYDSNSISTEDIKLLKAQFTAFVEEAIAHQDLTVAKISLISPEERKKLFEEWNHTKTNYPVDKCIHQLFEEQVAKTPSAAAVFCKGKSLTYSELNNRSNQLAKKLKKSGVGAETLVGISLHRSVDMMVAILGVLKAGGAYVPLDPEFPKDRILYMIQDSKCPVIIIEQKVKKELGPVKVKTISIDTDWKEISKETIDNFKSEATPENLSYVIYTSGSTGKPKGVMVQHKNVVNFFAGMDKHIKFDPPGVWLAVTSLSFDISVLELLWTLCRGFRVVIYAEEDWKSEQVKSTTVKNQKRIDFSLFYFSSYASENPENKYKLLIDGAKFADQNRFAAVWTPERHFHDFGGLYPNPAVTSAALATITKHVRIMSGSCVSPLHHPLRIAEDWSIVDNLSNGRIGISFAAGWQPIDFTLMPQNYENRKDIMFEQIEIVRKLWRGEAVEFDSPIGKKVGIKTLPRPIQKELPVWITAANNPETFQMAGERGFHLLTHLLGQTIEELEEKIAIYRVAWKSNGHPGEGYVTLMLHTFVGENLDEVRETVREPMKHYLNSAVNLVKLASWYFPTYEKLNDGFNEAAAQLSKEDMDAILNHSFERYFETSALLGTPETCLETVEKLKRVGVDEAACLIDFGVDSEKVLSHLQYLNAVKTLANLGVREHDKVEENGNYSIPELIRQQKVTHLQCTPSMAKMLLLDNDSKKALKNLEYLMIGGEAFPVNLANQLKETINGKLLNMYGPTETTIWSSTYKVDEINDSIPIGKPIANTEIFLLDNYQQLVPIGVPGELCIGGDGVVRGYFERPELTNERFISFSLNGTDSKKRIYRTGDLACYRKDGTIEFLGRLDHQVKIRGYRIELGEIETALEKHSLIREAVVIAREDTPGDKRLVAYLVGSARTKPTTIDLRNYLKESLPEYMVPSVFVFMNEFPLTPNGKVDRKALPAPESERPELDKEFESPQTPTEITLAKLWSQVLGIEGIGLHDNFFDLGGHSLSAVQITVKIHQTYNVDLSLQTFFQSSTLQELANAIDEKLLEQASGEQLEQLLKEVENSR